MLKSLQLSICALLFSGSCEQNEDTDKTTKPETFSLYGFTLRRDEHE
jgi:hypothetical protein